MEVRGQETALVFGVDKNTPEEESYQNEYKCQNFSTGGCSSNLRKCTNGKGHCRALNAFECL